MTETKVNNDLTDKAQFPILGIGKFNAFSKKTNASTSKENVLFIRKGEQNYVTIEVVQLTSLDDLYYLIF